MTKRDRILHGLVLPVVILVAGMLAVMNMESRAAAAEFGALAVLFMLIAALPLTLIVNSLLLAGESASRRDCFLRGMIVPGIALVAAVAYMTGLWDRLT